MNLGQTIRTLRKERHITKKELAHRAEISVTALANIENGDSIPQKSTVGKIARGLGCSLAFVLVSCVTEDDVQPEKRRIFKELWPILLKYFQENGDE